VRAMAASAARAGFRVYAADIFGDHDLREVACEVALIQPYPAGLPAAIGGFPDAPWLYTGALENHPRLLASMAASRPLAGSSPEAVTRVREPHELARTLREAGLLFPETCSAPAGVPTDGSWLVKPLESAGGRGIRPWYGMDADAQPHGQVWQRRVAGHRLSVGYVVSAEKSGVIAASRQLVGRRWCRAGRFAYCGSIDLDPDALDAPLRDQVVRLGNLLADGFGLQGLVGADLVVDARARITIIEINPRPTASLELSERSTGVSLAVTHLAACGIRSPSVTDHWPRSGTWAKAVLFAARSLDFSDASRAAVVAHSACWSRADNWPSVADIPEPPCPIPAGAPVCTVFAHGASPGASLTLLRRRSAAIEAAILG